MANGIRVPLGPYAVLDEETQEAKLTDEGRRVVLDWLDDYPEPVKLLMTKHRKLAMAAEEILGAEEVDALCRAGAARAALTFDPSRGFLFTTYCGPYLRAFVGKALEGEPTSKAARYGTGVFTAQRAEAGDSFSIFDYMPTPPQAISRVEDEQHLKAAVADILKRKLTKRERIIFEGRLGLNGPPQPLDRLGKMYGCTKERIRQIQVKATQKVRGELQKLWEAAA